LAKLQHYVPQFYLRSFASEGGKTPRIWCYDKARQKAFKTNIKNVAAERNFYEKSWPASPLVAGQITATRTATLFCPGVAFSDPFCPSPNHGILNKHRILLPGAIWARGF
jgi:hypothetical protein